MYVCKYVCIFVRPKYMYVCMSVNIIIVALFVCFLWQERRKLRDQIGPCGHCYGAGRPGECCNTCQDVRDAYDRAGWAFRAHGVLQCNAEAVVENARDEFANDGGCQVINIPYTHIHTYTV